MIRPFWEETYRDLNADTFGKPSEEIFRLARTLPKDSSVLDMGCGEGRNAIFLAGQGFQVDAFDISEAGIAKLLKVGADRKLNVNAWVEDITTFQFTKSYDFIISHGVLHLIQRDDWQQIIPRIKQFTRAGGVNVMAVFTDEIPPSEDLAPFTKGLFREGELAEWYADWQIEYSESYVIEDEHPNGIKHRHPINKVVAWNRWARNRVFPKNSVSDPHFIWNFHEVLSSNHPLPTSFAIRAENL